MATTTITRTLPKDVVPGMVIRINVPTRSYRTDFDCEVLTVKKVKRVEGTMYAITIQHPALPNLPVDEKNRQSTRYFMPRARVDVVHYEFASYLRPWNGIAWYGAIFSDEEEAKLWGRLEARGRRWDVGTWNGKDSGEWQARVHQ
jgi:hypothetical protein